MTADVVALVIIAFGAYRLAHVITGTDTLMEGTARRIEAVGFEVDDCGKTVHDDCGNAVPRHGAVVAKLVDLAVCPFCAGYWIGLAMLCAWFDRWPWELGLRGWITSLGIAGVQSFLTAIDGR